MSLPNISLLYTGAICIILSLIFALRGKHSPAVWLLFAGAIFTRLFAAHLDPFLNDWDERFHALVARNMMDHPFKPTLKPMTGIPYDYTAWCCNHVWLHKQPLFMWQMALSMKIFGVSEFAIRYPSVLLGSLMTPIIYRIGILTTKDRMIAFGAAVFMCCSFFQLDLISGRQGMDHNDVSFGFYVLASIWSYYEYQQEKKLSWVVMIGIFAGFAILNKWLTGLLVFSGWAINILLNIRDRDTRKELLHFTIALVVCTVVFLPWQLYIFHSYPAEAAYEYQLNTKHIFESVENHTGNMWFYLDLFPAYFGPFIWLLIPAGAIFSVLKKDYSHSATLACITYTLGVLIFFSVVVATKMPGYFFVAAPFCYLYMAIAAGQLLNLRPGGKIIFAIMLLPLCVLILRPDRIYNHHHPDDVYRQCKIYNTNIYKHAAAYLPKGTDVVMNLPNFGDIEFMFYNTGIPAFQYCCNKEEMNMLKLEGKNPAIFSERFGYPLPAHIRLDSNLNIIAIQLKSPEQHIK